MEPSAPIEHRRAQKSDGALRAPNTARTASEDNGKIGSSYFNSGDDESYDDELLDSNTGSTTYFNYTKPGNAFPSPGTALYALPISPGQPQDSTNIRWSKAVKVSNNLKSTAKLDMRVTKLNYAKSRNARQNIRRKHVPFRFMDLPTELRLQIEEYALTFGTPLRWQWRIYMPLSKIGGFAPSSSLDRMWHLTALTRICKEVHNETRGLVYRINDLEFDDFPTISLRPRVDRSQKLYRGSAVLEAVDFFTRHAPVHALNLQSITLRASWRDLSRFGHMARLVQDDLQLLIQAAQLLAPIEVKISNRHWHLRVQDIDKGSFDDVFIGKALQDARHAAGLDYAGRNWRLYPSIRNKDEGRERKKLLALAGKHEVVDWIENGF